MIGELRETPGIEVSGHPFRAYDTIESQVFARDVLLCRLYDFPADETSLWLGTRANARRDLLWFARQVIGLDRLDEEHHRPPADFLMDIFRTRHGFGNYRDPRGNGKSSLSTRAGSLWLLIQDPIECIERGWPTRGRESRLRITTLKTDFTYDFMRLLIKDLEQETLRWAFPEMIPDKIKRWSVKGVDVFKGMLGDLEALKDHPLFATYPAATPWLDPSLAPGSLEAGAAGAHPQADLIDDPVNEQTWNSEVNIKNAIHGIRQSFNLVRPEQGFRLVTGNHWVAGDPADVIDQEDGNWKVFMRSMTACKDCMNGYPTLNGIPERRKELRWAHEHVGETFTWLMKEADGSVPDPANIYKGCATKHIAMAQYENSPYAAEATMWESRTLPTVRFVNMTHSDQPPSLSSTLEKTNHEGNVIHLPVRTLTRGLAYDPAHGSETGKSLHALVAWMWDEEDDFLWTESHTWPSEQPLEALEGLVEAIFRLAPHKVGIESVGYQATIEKYLWRELLTPRTPCCFARYEDHKKPWCRDHILDKDRFVRASISENHIIKVTSSKIGKEDRVRDSLGPVVNAHRLCLAQNGPGFELACLAIDVFPVTIHDIADSASFLPRLFEGRPPKSSAERSKRQILARRQKMRRAATAKGRGGFRRSY